MRLAEGRVREPSVQRVEALPRFRLRHPEHQDEEFVAAPAEQKVVGADDQPDGVRDGADGPVAGGVAERVVDLLQVVEVYDGHAAGGVLAPAAVAAQQRVEGVPVQGLCERVNPRDAFRTLARLGQLTVRLLDLAAHALHQNHHRAEAEQGFQSQVED